MSVSSGKPGRHSGFQVSQGQHLRVSHKAKKVLNYVMGSFKYFRPYRNLTMWILVEINIS